jgi:uncharacterized protein YjbI with pentapeptide repeats
MATVPGVAAMNTTRLMALWRQAIAVLIVLTVFAGGIGAYAASRALWPSLLVWWPWLVAGAVPVVALGAWWLWWRLPRWQAERLRMTVRDVKARTDIEDNFRKTVGQLLGGAAVLVGAGFAYLQFSQQQQSARDLLISNQVAKGFELLGKKEKDEVTLRLGGIYALEGVMNTSKEYHRPVLEALCAFVRDGGSDDKPATDIQAALAVIGRRVVQEARPDLNHARIPQADLRSANLSGANLNGADLTGAELFDANLSDTELFDANLSNAYLWRANLSSATLILANLNNADLNDANLSSAFLSGANLIRANLIRANLSGANLSEVIPLNRHDAKPIRADLSGAKLIRANLSNADLSNADLSDAILSGANLSNAKGLTPAQLDTACGKDVKLDPGLTIKPCPESPSKPSQ